MLANENVGCAFTLAIPAAWRRAGAAIAGDGAGPIEVRREPAPTRLDTTSLTDLRALMRATAQDDEEEEEDEEDEDDEDDDEEEGDEDDEEDEEDED